MFHQHAHVVREVFVWHGVRLQRGMALTDADVHELELPENAELLRRCTRVMRDAVVKDETAIPAPPVAVSAPSTALSVPPVSMSAAAPVKE